MDVEDFITIILSIALIICIVRISTSKELFTSPVKEYNGMKTSKYFSSKKVIITGLIRNGEKSIYDSILFLYSQIVPHFNDYLILVYESDSTDETRNILLKQSSIDPKFIVMGCNDIKNAPFCRLSMAETAVRNRNYHRINKMVYLRNMYVKELKKQEYKDYDYVIVYDFDLNANLVDNGLLNSSYHFESDSSIDGICANGIYKSSSMYYDTYAFKGVDHNTARPIVSSDIERVKSCFGGFTIYKRASFVMSKYSTNKVDMSDKGVLCEHVNFNSCLNIFHNENMVLLIDDVLIDTKTDKTDKTDKTNKTDYDKTDEYDYDYDYDYDNNYNEYSI